MFSGFVNTQAVIVGFSLYATEPYNVKMNQFLYAAYGLTIALPFEFPGLSSREGGVDLRASFGIVQK